MSVKPTQGDIQVTYGDFTGASGAMNQAITDFQMRMVNFPFTYMGSGLESVFPTTSISGKVGSFTRYLGHNNSVKKGSGTGPVLGAIGGNSASTGVNDDWSFSASQRQSKQVQGSYESYQIDFAIQEGEINESQTRQTSEDIMRRIREAQQTTMVDVTFDRLNDSSFVGTTMTEDRFIGTIPSTLKWNSNPVAPAAPGRVTTGASVGWNIDKINAAKFLLAKNKVTSDGKFVVLSALDSLEGLTISETTRNGDYRSFVDSVFSGKQGEFFRQAPDYNFNMLKFVSFPFLHPKDDGSGRGVPCNAAATIGGESNVVTYNEFVVHPRCVQYIKPADEPTMQVMTYFDKNSWQLRFRGRQLIGFMVLNPTGICRVQNRANLSSF